jgi:hypothetical protein
VLVLVLLVLAVFKCSCVQVFKCSGVQVLGNLGVVWETWESCDFIVRTSSATAEDNMIWRYMTYDDIWRPYSLFVLVPACKVAKLRQSRQGTLLMFLFDFFKTCAYPVYSFTSFLHSPPLNVWTRNTKVEDIRRWMKMVEGETQRPSKINQ